MKCGFVRGGIGAVVVLAVGLLPDTSGRADQASPAAPAAKSATAATADDAADKSKPAPASAQPFSPGVDEILKMAQAGVTTEVLKAYVETAAIAYELNAADVIALKEHSVADQVVTAMIKRGAELVAQVNQSQAAFAAAHARSRSQRPQVTLDPEGYEYFQYYYLYPRTLAAANQRLYSPGPGLSRMRTFPSGYYGGYYGPAPFSPYRPSVFSPR